MQESALAFLQPRCTTNRMIDVLSSRSGQKARCLFRLLQVDYWSRDAVVTVYRLAAARGIREMVEGHWCASLAVDGW